MGLHKSCKDTYIKGPLGYTRDPILYDYSSNGLYWYHDENFFKFGSLEERFEIAKYIISKGAVYKDLDYRYYYNEWRPFLNCCYSNFISNEKLSIQLLSLLFKNGWAINYYKCNSYNLQLAITHKHINMVKLFLNSNNYIVIRQNDDYQSSFYECVESSVIYDGKLRFINNEFIKYTKKLIRYPETLNQIMSYELFEKFMFNYYYKYFLLQIIYTVLLVNNRLSEIGNENSFHIPTELWDRIFSFVPNKKIFNDNSSLKSICNYCYGLPKPII